MDAYDPAMAARVWQRVQGNPPNQEALPLGSMILEALEDEATLLLLAQKFTGRPNALLTQLARQSRGHVACLKGIHRICTGSHGQFRAPAPQNAPAATLLQRCYGRSLQACAQYKAAEGHPDYGHVFARLARETQAAGRLLLQLLGSLCPPQTQSK